MERGWAYSASLAAVAFKTNQFLTKASGQEAAGRVVREWRPRGPGFVSNKLMCLVHHLEHPKGSLLPSYHYRVQSAVADFSGTCEAFYIYSP